VPLLSADYGSSSARVIEYNLRLAVEKLSWNQPIASALAALPL
jgi:hypothetical protein